MSTSPVYPLQLEGEKASQLSRWLWLVKWLLLIPHAITLVVLWIGVVVSTVITFFAILITGRYPRSLFDFNLGVLRWSWRVGFYSYDALATDRYPPFSLKEEPGYPARLEVEYPESLSRRLVLVNSGEWVKGLRGAALTRAAFADFHIVGPIVLTMGLLTFVFSTILGWSYYGEKAAEYLLGPKVITPYRWIWVGAVMIGSILSLPTVWSLADVTNGLMAIPNLVSLIVLNGVIVSETRRYLWNNNLDAEAPASPASLTTELPGSPAADVSPSP